MLNNYPVWGYAYHPVHDEAGLLSNLKSRLEQFNHTAFSQKEFSAILNHPAKSNVFEKAKTLRDRFQLNRDNGDSFYLRFFDNEEWLKNLFQVTNQVTWKASIKIATM